MNAHVKIATKKASACIGALSKLMPCIADPSQEKRECNAR